MRIILKLLYIAKAKKQIRILYFVNRISLKLADSV
jgi:hypothetical protein